MDEKICKTKFLCNILFANIQRFITVTNHRTPVFWSEDHQNWSRVLLPIWQFLTHISTCWSQFPLFWNTISNKNHLENPLGISINAAETQFKFKLLRKSDSEHSILGLRGFLNCKNRWGSAFWWNRGGGFWNFKKSNFIITIRYEIPTFLSGGPFFEEGG